MAAPKRKAEADGAAVKKTKGKQDEPVTKRPRKSEGKENGEKPAKAPSVLQSEGNSFPRGGAGVLTPLEHKQIQVQAAQDVLFEQGDAKKAEDGEASDEEVAEPQTKQRSSKKKRKSDKESEKAQEDVEAKVVIEGISFKNLTPGTIVLGQISEITSQDLVLALPNNLSGFIPLTAISDSYTNRLEQFTDDKIKEQNDDESDDEDDLDLEEHFRIGQYLRAVVTSSENRPGSENKQKGRIELSINPRLVNKGISKTDIVPNAALQATVVSNEEHGLVMDLGLEEKDVKGFMATKELGGWKHSSIQEGTVFLCLVAGTSSDGRVVKLSVDDWKLSNYTKHSIHEAPTIDVFLPGAVTDITITSRSHRGITGKIIGSLDAVADIFQSGSFIDEQEMEDKYKIGSKVKGRVICTFPESESPKVAVSLLPHVIALSSPGQKEKIKPLARLPLSSFVESAKVIKTHPRLGLLLDVGVDGVRGYAHISRISDKKIDSLLSDEGKWKVGSFHRARVIGYNRVDGLFMLSLQESILNLPFLRYEDLRAGQMVQGTINKFQFTDRGTAGIRVNLPAGIRGFVPELHMGDVHLQHPERKFREGMSVNARILNVDVKSRKLTLTLKKSFVNSDAEVWSDYDSITEGSESIGSILKVTKAGAVLAFFGEVRGFLPLSEMSEAYIADATQNFSNGQTLTVRCLSVNADKEELKLTCKDPKATTVEERQAFKDLEIGSFVTGTVSEKLDDRVTLDIPGGLRGSIRIGHFADGSEKREKSRLKKMKIGTKIDEDILVLKKMKGNLMVSLTMKESLLEASRNGLLPSKFEDFRQGGKAVGSVRNVTDKQVFVEFAGGFVAAIFRSQIPDDMVALPSFGLSNGQTIEVRIVHLDDSQQRVWLSMKAPTEEVDTGKKAEKGKKSGKTTENSASREDGLSFGKTVQATIRNVKATQLNVKLPGELQGRVDVSEVYDKWDQIPNKKQPLEKFKAKQKIDLQVLGVHDARNHRFLPISHRHAANPVLELTAKQGQLNSPDDLLSMDKIKTGDSHVAYIHSIESHYVWAKLSPRVSGQIKLKDLSDDISLLADMPKNFPPGTAVQVTVKSVDQASGKLDLIAQKSGSSKSVTWDTISKDMIVVGRVMKKTEQNVLVSLSPDVVGAIPLTEVADDYDNTKSTFSSDDIVRVKVMSVDLPGKKVLLSARPSVVLDSSIKPKDPQIPSFADVKVNDVVRGFVKNPTDHGLFVMLSPTVNAFVRVSDLSDAFIKEWKSAFQTGQLVKGKVIHLNPALNHIQMTLKASMLDKNYTAPLTLDDLEVGQVVTGRVRAIKEFGVFIDVDNSNHVSGLCHKSQMADNKIENATTIFEEGDAVKAKVLKVDKKKRQIAFGLKASYFEDEEDEESDIESDDDEEVHRFVKDDEAEGGSDSDEEGGVAVDTGDGGVAVDAMDIDEPEDAPQGTNGLSASGFDWSGAGLDTGKRVHESDSDFSEDEKSKNKKKRRKPELQVDKTGELDVNGPRSVADFERLLLGQPHSSLLWIEYMAFQMKLNEVDKAREIANRALRTIDSREEEEKMQVRIALLNLENTFGSNESLEEAFKEACTYHDKRLVHDRLVDIYVQSGKLEKADETYTAMTKNKSFTPDPALWLSYATFLLNTRSSPPRARSLLQRALQSVPSSQHRLLTAKFGSLEYKSPNGDKERGRTVFEGLLSAYSKKWDLWDMYLDLERKHGEKNNVRQLFERQSRMKLRGKRGRVVFERWENWEREQGNQKGVDRVKVLRKEWEKQREEDKAKGDESD